MKNLDVYDGLYFLTVMDHHKTVVTLYNFKIIFIFLH